MRLSPESSLMYPPKIAISLNIMEKQTVSLISRTKAQRTGVQIQTHDLTARLCVALV